LFAHPQFAEALLLSLWTGTAAFAVSLAVAIFTIAAIYRKRLWRRVAHGLGLWLALPHLAFAIGLAFLVMPSGLLARVIAGLARWAEPPDWPTVHDPLGLALIAALVFKETPFLALALWSVLERSDVAQSLAGQWRAASSLGHRPHRIWLAIMLPQVLPRIVLPLAAVWIYACSVVDMALVLGPTRPPTLGVVIWRDLNDADSAINQRGAAGAVVLAAVLAAIGVIAATFWMAAEPLLRRASVAGPHHFFTPRPSGAREGPTAEGSGRVRGRDKGRT
jgi:putative thiamine transport system permease protein